MSREHRAIPLCLVPYHPRITPATTSHRQEFEYDFPPRTHRSPHALILIAALWVFTPLPAAADDENDGNDL